MTLHALAWVAVWTAGPVLLGALCQRFPDVAGWLEEVLSK